MESQHYLFSKSLGILNSIKCSIELTIERIAVENIEKVDLIEENLRQLHSNYNQTQYIF